MAAWRSAGHLRDLFRRHRRDLHLRTIEEYAASAEETIAIRIYFEYLDRETNDPRVGYYDRATERVTSLTEDETEILTHFRCQERYVARTLRGSTDA